MIRPAFLTGALFTLALPVAACAHEEAPASSAIADFDAELHEETVSGARWEIIIHSGAGIPGTAGAGDFYRRPKQVLQAIIDTCDLGASIYRQATDGVSILTIANPALSDDQIACIRSAEDNGLRLSDRGSDRGTGQ